MVRIGRKFTFEAAHYLPEHPGLCRNVHGHSYKLWVEVSGETQVNGMVFDFGHLKKAVETCVIEKLDHINLNQLTSNPTAEVLVIIIKNSLNQHLPKRLRLERIQLWETENCYAEWRREDDIRKS